MTGKINNENLEQVYGGDGSQEEWTNAVTGKGNFVICPRCGQTEKFLMSEYPSKGHERIRKYRCLSCENEFTVITSKA